MPLSAAEKQRRYRQKRDNDAQRRAEYLEKEKKKYLEDLTSGKKKLVGQMTDREKRHQRKIWKKRKQTQRQRKRIEHKVMSANTSSQSPSGSPHPESNRVEYNVRKR